VILLLSNKLKKQVKDGVETVTDLKSDAKYQFFEIAQSGNNHICGAELDSPHFHTSAEGYESVLESEIVITYKQGEITKTLRRLLTYDLQRGNFWEDEEFSVGDMDAEDELYKNKARKPDTDLLECEFEVGEEGLMNALKESANDASLPLNVEKSDKNTSTENSENKNSNYMNFVSASAGAVAVILIYFAYSKTCAPKPEEYTALLGDDQ